MSQNNRILAHLKRNRPITALQALKLFGCMRLARVINDLRNLNFDIATTMINDRLRDTRYASYSLQQGESK